MTLLLHNTVFLFSCLVLLVSASGHTKEEWRSRAIYQVLTDRFSRTSGDSAPCPDLHKYCGGTWKGITRNLGYIKGLGFDAIWISPVVDNTPDGYHGYWARDWDRVNALFGSEEDLKELVAEAHKRGIWVMVDVIANHVGPVHLNYTTIRPFNSEAHYHDYCLINDPDFEGNQTRVENCRLADLPDLKQENPFVRDYLLAWVKALVEKFDLDGLRVDTTPEVPKSFWEEYSKAAGVFTLGEVFSNRLEYVRGYIGPVDSVLNYPWFYALRNSFRGSSFWDIWDVYSRMEALFGKELDYMGVFVDNHDNIRLRHMVSQSMVKSALAFSLVARGIPILYYGSEQGFSGENDPYNREPLWTSMNPASPMYRFIASVNAFRRNRRLWAQDFLPLMFDDHIYAFKRGTSVCVFANNEYPMSRNVGKVPFPDNSRLCNYLERNDCVTVKGGAIHVELKLGEMVKLYTLN